MKRPWDIILAIVVFALCVGNLVYLIKVYQKEKELKQRKGYEYQIVITDSTMTLYDMDRIVAKDMKIPQPLDSVFIEDNQ